MFNLIPWRKKDTSGRLATQQEFRPLATVRDEFDRLFVRFFSRWPAKTSRWNWPELSWSGFWGLDREDRDHEVVFRAEAPGFEADDFDVHISGNLRTIRAERKHERTWRGGDGRAEHRSFRRMFTLPPGCVADKVEAKYHSGVLEVHTPKSEPARGKRITMKAA
jgi:HSP20 family protein